MLLDTLHLSIINHLPFHHLYPLNTAPRNAPMSRSRSKLVKSCCCEFNRYNQPSLDGNYHPLSFFLSHRTEWHLGHCRGYSWLRGYHLCPHRSHFICCIFTVFIFIIIKYIIKNVNTLFALFYCCLLIIIYPIYLIIIEHI